MNTADVVIAGAGIIGLSAALELASAGLRVTVIDRGRAMRESSWAAAGMLAVNDPEEPAKPRPLFRLSGELYPEYLRHIEQLSGMRVPLRTTTALQATPGRFEQGLPASELTWADATLTEQLAPGLSNTGGEFLQLKEASLDPRDLCAALPRAAAAAGVEIVEDAAVIRVLTRPGASLEVQTSRATISAGSFVNCAGAWSGQIELGAHPHPLPVRPRKGQMLAVSLAAPELRCVLRTPDVYLVPRAGGRIVIGATVEDCGFDKQVQPAAIHVLKERAAAIWPPIASARIVESWAGLRPGTPDGLPFIGPACDSAALVGAWVATGHYRNGILLAPATARLILQLVIGLGPQIDLTPYQCDRFKAEAALQAPAIAG